MCVVCVSVSKHVEQLVWDESHYFDMRIFC